MRTPEAADSLVSYGEEEAMKHWDEIIALKKRIGISDSFRPTIHHPLRPDAMTARQHVNGFTFENMTPQDEAFLRQKFHLNRVDSTSQAHKKNVDNLYLSNVSGAWPVPTPEDKINAHVYYVSIHFYHSRVVCYAAKLKRRFE